jgi:hypothetical protein
MNVEKELFKAAPMVQHDGQSCPQKAHFLKASMEIHNSPSWIRKFQISQRHPQSTLKTSVQYLAPKNPIPMRTSLDFMTFLQESLLQNQVDANLLVANPFFFYFLERGDDDDDTRKQQKTKKDHNKRVRTQFPCQPAKNFIFTLRLLSPSLFDPYIPYIHT